MSKNYSLEVTNNDTDASIVKFLTSLLEQGSLDALLVSRELPTKVGVVQSLTTISQADGVTVLAPVMPVNSSVIVSDMTRMRPSDKHVGLVIRSCEIRALIELMKLQQASLENLTIIGIDCPGTYSVTDYKEKIARGETPSREILDFLKDSSKEPPLLRESCRVCEYPVPENTDIAIGLFGMDTEKQVLIQGNTEMAEKMLTKLGLNCLDNIENRVKAIAKIVEDRTKKRDELFAVTQQEACGLDNLVSFFATCIGCHNCMRVCPICYCKQCLFESATFEFEFSQYFRRATKKKTIRMPTDTVLFHLGRMNHMLTSCVDCGMCEQACPSKIELLKVLKFVGHNVRKAFDYVPGRSRAEELPIATFKEEELEPR